MHTYNVPFGFLNRTADLNKYMLETVLHASAHRESWFDELEQNVNGCSQSYLSKERDYGYQAIQSLVAKQKIRPAVRYRIAGAMRSLFRNGLSKSYFDLICLDDMAFTQAVKKDANMALRIEGAYRAFNLFKEKKEKPSLLLSDRIHAIQRLQDVHLVHFSHSWQGPYKAAFVHGKDQVLRVELSGRTPLYTIASCPYVASDWSDYMVKAPTTEFRSALASSVPQLGANSFHQLLCELLPAVDCAA